MCFSLSQHDVRDIHKSMSSARKWAERHNGLGIISDVYVCVCVGGGSASLNVL